MLAHKLEHEGIPAHVHGADLLGAVGGLPMEGLVRVFVDDEDFEKACDIIKSLETEQPAPHAPVDKTPPAGLSMAMMSAILAGAFFLTIIAATTYYNHKTSPVAVQLTPEQISALNDAKAAYNRLDYQTALKLLQPLASLGNAQAEHVLGLMYEQGLGVKQDYSEAMRWYRMAADQGSAGAEWNIGWMYWRGEGVKQDGWEAEQWIFKAANQGLWTAQFDVGAMYEIGNGVQQDYAEAYFWYSLAERNSFNAATAGYPEISAAKADVAKHLSDEQRAAAKRRVNEWKATLENRL